MSLLKVIIPEAVFISLGIKVKVEIIDSSGAFILLANFISS